MTRAQFSGCRSLKALDVSRWDVSKVESMAYPFSGCALLQEIPVGSWDVSGVESFASMFYGCSDLLMDGTALAGTWTLGPLNIARAYVSEFSQSSSGTVLKVRLDNQLLVEGVDYTYTVSPRDANGQIKITITGQGAYKGTLVSTGGGVPLPIHRVRNFAGSPKRPNRSLRSSTCASSRCINFFSIESYALDERRRRGAGRQNAGPTSQAVGYPDMGRVLCFMHRYLHATSIPGGFIHGKLIFRPAPQFIGAPEPPQAPARLLLVLVVEAEPAAARNRL